MWRCVVSARKRATVVIAVLVGLLSSLGVAWGNEEGAELVVLPGNGGSWAVSSDMRVDPLPSQVGTVEIRGVGTFTYDPQAITTLQPRVFAQGRFSAFDVLVHLSVSGQISLVYVYDDTADTYIIQSLNGLEGWWYDARVPGGAFERTALRMDLYPMKDGTSLYVYLEDPARLAAIEAGFREEVALRSEHGGQIIVPVVTIKGPRATTTFENVLVTSHNVRPDLFQPGVITVLDVLLSLGEQGKIASLDLAWHAEVDGVANVNHYMVDWIGIPDVLGEKSSTCGYMDQAATEGVRGYLTPHSHATTKIHISSDVEVLVSPGFVEWQWVCASS
jgi:hypothetical protein